MSDFSFYKALETARVSSSQDIVAPGAPVSQSHTREAKYNVANLSASLTTEQPVVRVPYTAALKTAFLTASANAVANSTDYSNVSIFKHTGNGAAVLMASANLSNVAVTKLVPIALTLVANAANTAFAAGDYLTANVALTGNGTANNAVCVLDVTFEDV